MEMVCSRRLYIVFFVTTGCRLIEDACSVVLFSHCTVTGLVLVVWMVCKPIGEPDLFMV